MFGIIGERERKDSAESVLEQTGRKGFGRMNLNTALYWEMQARKIALEKLGKSQTLTENPGCHDFFFFFFAWKCKKKELFPTVSRILMGHPD